MPFLTQEKTNFPYLLTVIALAVIAGGFILGYYYFWIAEMEARLVELESKLSTEIPKAKTADWNSYTNEKYGYTFKYPKDCLYGPLPGECKQLPPEERSQECLCFLNGEDPDSVGFQSFIGEKDNLTLATLDVSHHSTDFYNPPADRDLIDWLKEKASYQDIPDETNMELDGIPAVRVYTPQSPGAYSQEDIYFISNDKLFKIYMVNVDNEYNKEFYSQILSTFSILE